MIPQSQNLRLGLVQWKKATLVGVGLLGGSLGLALKQRGLARSVVGYVRCSASISECTKARAVDEATCELNEAVHGADLIVLCTPISTMRPLVRRMLPALKRGAIVTDVGSVKGSVVRDLDHCVAQVGAHFIGSHPMAGSERTGVQAAHADLFANAICVVTPTRRSSKTATRKITALWRAVGARPMLLDPVKHDKLVSRSSHLTHLVAAQLAAYVLHPQHPPEQALLCANGFRDTTRIAASSPEMWRDITLANRTHIDRALQRFIRELTKLHHVIRAGDARRIEAFFAGAQQRRQQWQLPSAAASPE